MDSKITIIVASILLILSVPLLLIVMFFLYAADAYIAMIGGVFIYVMVLTVFATSLIANNDKQMRNYINQTGTAYRKALFLGNFGEAATLWKDQWSFSFNPNRSGLYGKLNIITLVLSVFGVSLVALDLLRIYIV